MKLFLDTADIGVLTDLAKTGLVDGVTTNPSIIAKSGRQFLPTIKEICELITGPVSAEVAAMDHETMLKEGLKLAEIADNVAVKVPLTRDGLITCAALADQGIMVNVTLCFTPSQALLAAKAGASFISPFVGRLDDLGQDGMQLVRDIRAIYDQFGFATEVLAASIRRVDHVNQAALAGADCATIPPAVFSAMYQHDLTDKGLAIFKDDWAKTGQSIL